MNPSSVPPPLAMHESPSPPEGTDALVPLAPPLRTPQPTEERPPPSLRRLDLLLVYLVVFLAFLAASTAARNSDLWLHLASGRALAEGGFRFQGDPFGQSDATWINHAWLYDLISYELFVLFPNLNGSLLVVVKALLAAWLAWMLVRLGRNDRSLFWPVLSATLAIVTLSGRMLLQPALVSAVLLALTLVLLERGRRLHADEATNRLRSYAPVCMLFALWANLDDWFLLGPLTVLLYFLGDLLAGVADGDKRRIDPFGMGVTCVVGVLACLLTPFHFQGLTVPQELGFSAAARVLQSDPLLRYLFLSPFEESYFHPGKSWSLSALAYAALLGLSGLSFLGSRNAWRSWRLPAWLTFGGLSAWSIQAVPFFAVVAAPVLSLNFEDLVERLHPQGLGRRERILARAGRLAALVLLLALSAATWPGWIQGAPYEMRRWVVLADPSLEKAAEKLSVWRNENRLTTEQRGFNFTPKSANYFTWLCPEEKGLLDGRMLVSPREAEEYLRIRRALGEAQASETDWREYFRSKKINHIVLDGSDKRWMSVAFQRLISSPEWFPMSVVGNTTIFGWLDPQKIVPPPRCQPFSARREAYHPEADEIAPLHGVVRNPEAQPWWRFLVAKQPAGHADRDEAALFLLAFDTLQGDYLTRNHQAWDFGFSAATVALGGGTLPSACQLYLSASCMVANHLPADRQMQLPKTTGQLLALELQKRYFLSQDDAPNELLLLALRAGRRGVHADPGDAAAYSLLGDAYLRVSRNTRERAWTDPNPPPLPFLRRMRAIQTATAYNRAVKLDPDLLPPHLGLVALYDQYRLDDLSLHHLREALRILQSRTASSAATPEQRTRMLAEWREQVREREQRLQNAINSYEIGSAKLRNATDRAGMAQSRGLAETALKLLMDSDVAAFGPEGMEMELGLLLITGRIDTANEWLLPEHEFVLGSESYHINRILIAAANGDYASADDEMKAMLDATVRPVDFYKTKVPISQALALAFAQMVLDAHSERESLPRRYAVYENRQKLLAYTSKLIETLAKGSDIRSMRGLLALECGNVAEAKEQFRAALRGNLPGFDFNAHALAEHFLARLSEPQ